MEKKKQAKTNQVSMKKMPLVELLSALDSQVAIGAILIGKYVNANEIARLHFSQSSKDEDKLNSLKKVHEILYFFGTDDCPIEDTEVYVLIVEKLYIVKTK